MKARYILLTLLGLAGALSCSKFLEEIPATSVSKASAYQSPEALEAALIGAYGRADRS